MPVHTNAAVTQVDARPDIARGGVGLVKVSTWDVGTPERQRAAIEAIGAAWRKRSWPDLGLLSYTVHVGNDGRTLLHYSQWTDEDAYQQFFSAGFRDERNAEIDAAVPGIQRLGLHSYELYRGGRGNPDDLRIPGCVVIVEVEFDGPDRDRQRDWVDGVFDALASDPGLTAAEGPDGDDRPGAAGISGWFHLGADGTRVLNYAEWTDAASHVAALAAPGDGIGSATEAWERVHSYPGVRESRVNRYTPGLSLHPGA
ncbi:antibiotic biosynthesis monooxygenase [Streptomyces sp. NPDC017979]|uniref:antibiotic biosynthesis monooxygenase n=1 Tax=Streptomyces sp. NPDC017979 TaxID=3365024 RepID=UPI00379AB0A6